MSQEYYAFMWVALSSLLESTNQEEVQFKAYLPKDDEHYWFCYVDQDNVVQRASIPSQFYPEHKKGFMILTTKGQMEGIQWH